MPTPYDEFYDKMKMMWSGNPIPQAQDVLPEQAPVMGPPGTRAPSANYSSPYHPQALPHAMQADKAIYNNMDVAKDALFQRDRGKDAVKGLKKILDVLSLRPGTGATALNAGKAGGAMNAWLRRMQTGRRADIGDAAVERVTQGMSNLAGTENEVKAAKTLHDEIEGGRSIAELNPQEKALLLRRRNVGYHGPVNQNVTYEIPEGYTNLPEYYRDKARRMNDILTKISSNRGMNVGRDTRKMPVIDPNQSGTLVLPVR